MQPEILALSIVILLFSVIVHEVAHGYVAKMFGDRTAENAGRLTLNPIPHIDLYGSILLPALLIFTTGGQILFGWAKPVPVNPLHFSNIRKGELLVSAAGIISNFVLALIGAALFRIGVNLFPDQLILSLLVYMVQINLMLAFFNLIPLPPLDGSKILISQLNYEAARKFESLSMYGAIFLIILAFSGFVGVLYGIFVSPLARLLLGV